MALQAASGTDGQFRMTVDASKLSVAKASYLQLRGAFRSQKSGNVELVSIVCRISTDGDGKERAALVG